MELTSDYLGLSLKNPMIASASPLNASLSNLVRLEDAGAAAVVLPSLFQEQIEAEERALNELVDARSESFPEALTYMPFAASGPYGLAPDRYLDHIRRAREALSIPVIASLNGYTEAGWIEYATLMEQAGANAIELNIHVVPTDTSVSAADVESRYLGVLRAVRAEVRIPVAMKLAPCFTALGHFALQLGENGADGVVLFNRLVPLDIDLPRMRLFQELHLSDPHEMHLPLYWIALLSGRTGTSLAASTGVETVDDVVKYLLVGADAVMVTSSLIRHGVDYMARFVDGLQRWLEFGEFASIDEARGLMSWLRAKDKSVYERTLHLHGHADYPVRLAAE